MTSRYEKKNRGSPYSFFQKLRSKTAGFCRLLYVFQLQVQGFTTPNRCSKKTVPRIFLKKPPEPFWYSAFLLNFWVFRISFRDIVYLLLHSICISISFQEKNCINFISSQLSTNGYDLLPLHSPLKTSPPPPQANRFKNRMALDISILMSLWLTFSPLSPFVAFFLAFFCMSSLLRSPRWKGSHSFRRSSTWIMVSQCDRRWVWSQLTKKR